MNYDNPHWYYLDFFTHFGKNYSDGMINVMSECLEGLSLMKNKKQELKAFGFEFFCLY
jgi:hypothetical protein